jgi:hypothetical protein
MGFTDLIKSIEKSFTGAVDSLLGRTKGARKWPNEFKPVTNDPGYNDGSWRTAKSYSFNVVQVKGSTIINSPAQGWQEFELQINPQELQQDEVFAIQVTPTLRGVLVEHQGVLIKDITVSGTTGVSPLRKEGGAKSQSGNPVLASGHSGYEEFHELRSYFRAYAEAKRQDAAGELRMVFTNRKDSESIFVEPQKFTMKRSASKPFMYDYTIVLKGIGNAEFKKQNSAAFLPALEAIDKALDYIAYGTQVINGSIGLIRRTERDITSTLLDPLKQINLALIAIKGGKAVDLSPFGITRRFMENFEKECRRIEANFNDVLGRDTASYNAATGRVSTLRGSSGRQSTYQELKVLNALNILKKMSNTIIAQPKLFANDPNKQSKAAEAVYQSRTLGTDGTLKYVNEGNLSLSRPSNVKSIAVGGGDTLQVIAARELGDPDRFKEIVLLNNLKPPYISETGGPGVLKPGDPLLIPKAGEGGGDTGVRMNKDYEIARDLEFSKKSLGVDIRLDDEYDIVFANFGDYDLVAGIENMAQAILLKILYENGSLKRHPQIGASLGIGGKVRDLNITRANLLASLNSDTRVDSVPYLSLKQEGSTTIIEAAIKVVGTAQPVPVTVEV